MSSISSVGSSTAAQYASVSNHRRPSASKMAEDLFSQLDTKGQGYLEKSDLESALSQVSSGSSSSSSASADDVFSALDSNGDGKVTKDEMSSSLQKLSDQLDSQFNQSRMSDAMGAGGMPPPPPGGGDQGMTLDQMKSVASNTTDSNLSSLLKNISSNFDKADTNGDGKVSQQEAMAYQQASQTDSSSSSSSSSSNSNSASNSSEAAVMKRIMDLVHAYGSGGNNGDFSQLLNSIATSA